MHVIPFDRSRLPFARRLAEAARLAYREPGAVRRQAAAWGFPEVRTFCVPHRVPFPLEDTQAFAMGNAETVVVAFRGTEPGELRDWLTDCGALMVPYASGDGMVHLGFEQALDAVWPEILTAVRELRTGNQKLWFTGHSLGGALAMLAAARMYFADPRLLADGVYTFGQPRTCDPILARAYDTAFKGRMFRFVNNSDIVPKLPPDPLYRHVALEQYFDASGRLLPRPPSLLVRVCDALRGHLRSPASFGVDAFRDHGIGAYIQCLTANSEPAREEDVPRAA
ncbi:Lipase (class 3) [Actinomadura rubteroloni]|uniref:Lipase (Class 3) n=1 Tax=Actinomadura rubteroloni TaxID=1926885 RepID=A0A2P4UHQ7_9ACTN|nr:lipase family protein [Actinomadura rubteroloni]POM24573.1 Lipase (class 3) [Actinomadura rubteroloni]